MTRSRLLSTGIIALAASTMLAGCWGLRPGYRQGGSGISNDTFTYYSTTWVPKTITLVDTAADEEIWSIDVPVGKQLVIRFYENENEDAPHRPDSMRWGIMDQGKRVGGLDNSMPVPSNDHRVIEVSLRETPEYPSQASGD